MHNKCNMRELLASTLRIQHGHIKFRRLTAGLAFLASGLNMVDCGSILGQRLSPACPPPKKSHLMALDTHTYLNAPQPCELVIQKGQKCQKYQNHCHFTLAPVATLQCRRLRAMQSGNCACCNRTFSGLASRDERASNFTPTLFGGVCIGGSMYWGVYVCKHIVYILSVLLVLWCMRFK